MIKKFIFGKPVVTGSIINDIKEDNISELSCFKYDNDCSLLYTMNPNDIVYGLGQTVRGINKRGFKYISYNKDPSVHTEEKSILYSSHNFIIIDGKERFGIFIDTPSKVTYDIGYTNYDELKISFAYPNYNLYLFVEDELIDIIKDLRHLTGKSYIPPLWAFGFNQSRYGYKNKEEIDEVIKHYRDNDMPIDMITLDLDYMDNYKVFTINKNNFPNIKQYNDELLKQGIHLVPIVDAGIKAEEGYDIYDECIKNGYYCKDKNNKPCIIGVWPGKTIFPDYMNEEAANWFGSKYSKLLDVGIRGFWNDMNEPSIFYSENRLKETFKELLTYKDKELNRDLFFGLLDLVGSIDQRDDYFEEMYHNIDNKLVNNNVVHNMFGYKMSEAASKQIKKHINSDDYLLFSRSSFIGMHRSAGIWFGDNCSWFSHILLNLKQAANVNMTGFLYSGADTCGFRYDVTPDLALRWLQLSIFMPLFRNHSSRDTRNQEFYRFGMIDSFKNMLKLRYSLIPYIYSEFIKASINDDMFIKPLSFVYKDERCKDVEDQVMVGESIMIAPIYTQNAKGRNVYIPEDMMMYRFKSPTDYKTKAYTKGDYYIECNLDEVLLFVRKGHGVVLANTDNVRCTRDLDFKNLKMIKYDDNQIEYIVYLDKEKTLTISG